MLVAAVQLTSKPDKTANLIVVSRLMNEAVKRGAKLVAVPEYFSCMGSNAETFATAESPRQGEAYDFMRGFAAGHGVYVLAGTIATRSEKQQDRLANRSTLFGPEGKELATYDKLHLYDATFAETAAYRESDSFVPGSAFTVADTSFGKVGFSICYDLRFPELFRALATSGAQVIFVPSAFTMHTGKDHWLPLLRARAIENQVYIVAPAQFGTHTPSKTCYGKSCIIDPWGNVLAQAPDRESVIVADIDFGYLEKVRRELPVATHRRKDLFPI